MKSIRNFLIIVLLSVICLVNFVAALHGYQRSMQQADQLITQQLRDAGQLLLQLYEIPATDPENESNQTHFGRQPKPASHAGLGDDLLFQIWRDNQLIALSSNAPQQRFAEARSAGAPQRFYRGKQWRYEFVHQPPLDMIVAQNNDRYTQLIETMIVESILPIIWVLPFIGILIWLIVKRGLGPLRNLAKRLQQRGDNDLSPIENHHYPEEITGVATAINQLMQRLELAFERERRFAADAAHELRTPLAGLKVNLHNLVQQAQQDQSNESLETIWALEAGVDRMSHSIEQILALHRFSPEQFNTHLESIELVPLVQECIAESYTLINQRAQTIELISSPCNVRGDRFALTTVVRNLIDNACKYTPQGGKLIVSVGTRQKVIFIRVEDSGPGIPEREQQRVTSRFYRVGGDSHHSGIVGSGLGLSIIESITQLHRGQLSLSRSEQLGGLCAQVEIPVDPRDQKASL